MLARYSDFLLNIKKSSMVCNCAIHDNDRLLQIDAQLPNGRPIRILLDSYGYHVAIGEVGMLGDFPRPSKALDEAEVARVIQAALM